MNTPGTNNLDWLTARLQAMSLDEILFRVRFELKKRKWRKKIPYLNSKRIAAPVDGEFDLGYNIPPEIINLIIEEASKYLNHQWLFFGLNLKESPIDWHADPQSGKSAPQKFGFDINHRDENLVGNIKNTWEKNRHHHLTILALAFYYTKDEKYTDEIAEQLGSWIDQNPYLIGVNWTHPLEQGIRLISWVYISLLIKGSKYYDHLFGEDGIMWSSIYAHQQFIVDTYSRGSSANNHLIGEMAGLFISAVYWPVFKESDEWKALSSKILEDQLIRQTYRDGVNKELAFSYQIFVLEFGLLAYISEPKRFSGGYLHILKNMLDVVYKLQGIMGTAPNYGDGDEGMALQIYPIGSNKVDWLLDASRKYLNVDFDAKKIDTFYSSESGVFARKWNVGSLTFSTLIDVGPLGMGSLAAHGHADALSFTLSINEVPLLIDPGTFCYHDNLKFREYFRGTKAHNTISINGRDQSEQLGPFLWGKKARCTVLKENVESGYIMASHNGYQKNDGIIHTREFECTEQGMIIIDHIDGSGEKEVELRFHVHPDRSIQTEENSVRFVNDFNVALNFDHRMELKVLNQEDNGGWFSPFFGVKEETNTILLSQLLTLPTQLRTEIIKL